MELGVVNAFLHVKIIIYVSGQQPNVGATDKDLCWPLTDTITPTDMATASVWLDGKQSGCVKNSANGFCSCATDWTA